jgi:hypothetical protein
MCMVKDKSRTVDQFTSCAHVVTTNKVNILIVVQELTGFSMAEWSMALIFVSLLLASHSYGHRFQSCSLRKLNVKKFPATCGRTVV